MRKKNECKFFFLLRRQLMGYCPFESRYNGLYHDTGLGGWPGRSQGVTTRSGWYAAGPAIRPQHGHDTGHDTVGMRVGRAAARTHGLTKEIVAIQNFVLQLGDDIVGRDIARGLAARLYRETSATRCREPHDTTGVGPTTRPAKPATRPRHGWLGRSVRSLCVQHGFKVCTWCTQPSF